VKEPDEAISRDKLIYIDCFAEFILSRMLRFFASLRMTQGEGLTMTMRMAEIASPLARNDTGSKTSIKQKVCGSRNHRRGGGEENYGLTPQCPKGGLGCD